MPLPCRKKNSSFVLVLVLGMLVLISVLVIGFLGHVASQTKSSTSYRDLTGTLLLGDVAVNVVKAQIDAATTASTNSSNGACGLWASQPGAIRTVSSTGTQTTYKLYSSANLLDTSTGITLKADILGDLPPTGDASDWSGSALWTDLNAPAVKSDGTYAYPIIDVTNDATDLPAGTTTTAPFATGSFNVDSTPANNPIGATRVAGSSSSPLPMPVRWLYVLKQGQVIAPDAGSTATQLTFGNAPTVPTTANPIVGRIAFWTDDDTCRVNINTASYGTFWDTPRFTSTDDSNLATDQPVHNEFQRYPGHAATTTLALALPELASSPETLIGLTPRYSPGGSTEGTIPTYTSSALSPSTNRLYASVDELLFTTNFTSGERTASSLTKPQVETAKFFLTAHSRAPELTLFGEPRVAMWPISSLTNTTSGSYRTSTDQLIAFCATLPSTNSVPSTNAYYFTRAPHTLLTFGQWQTGLTGSNSSTTDVNIPRNIAILNYLDYFTSVPLPGNLSVASTFDSKYAPSPTGMRQILTEIFDYIRITNARDPLLDPYNGQAFPPANNVYLNVPYAAPDNIPNATNNNFADGQILPTLILPTNAAPNLNWGTYGFGRFNGRLVEATLVFVAVGKGASTSTPLVTGYPLAAPAATSNCNPVPQAQCGTTYNTSYNSSSAPYTNTSYYTGYTSGFPSNTYLTALPISTNAVTPAGSAPVGGVPPSGYTAVQAVFALSFFDPALGFAESIPQFTVTVSGLNSLWLNSSSNNLKFPTTGTFVMEGNGAFDGQPSNLGSVKPFPNMIESSQFKTGLGGFGTYPFYSNIVNVTNNASAQMILGGGTNVTVSVYPLNTQYASPGYPIHTYTLDLSKISSSSYNLPIPNLSSRPLFGSIRTLPSPRLQGWPPTNWASGVPPTGALYYPDRFDTYSINYVEDTNNAHGDYIDQTIDTYNDTIISMVPTAAYGDYRMLAATNTPSSAFTPHPNYSVSNRLAYGLEFPDGLASRGSSQGRLITNAAYYTQPLAGAPYAVNPGYSATPLVPATVSNPTSGTNSAPPDFDNGFGPLPDGPYINKPDEGMIYPLSAGVVPYFNNVNIGLMTNFQNFVSPEREVPSPVMFGSLPTGAPLNGSAATPKPWQTLLFQPGAAGHAGWFAPKDEYLLDLFWMPQAEPYAISEPFSTAGKINLNYQMLPFLYIDRSTGIQSVLASEKVATVGTSQAAVYKDRLAVTSALRSSLNLSEVDGTLRQFVQKFNTLDFFHAPAEICDVYLVPQGQTWTSDSTAQSTFYGPNFALVGDNTREKPYADIYSRLTTKSNSFTVYYRVQTLKNPSTANPATWTEGQGALLGDYRGSTTLERYIDPNDTTIPDYTSAAVGTANLETHYKWRVVENTRFAP